MTKIKDAIRIMACDNGCVNRIEGDPTERIFAEVTMGMTPEMIAGLEGELQSFSEEEFEAICVGDVDEIAAHRASVELKELLDKAYEAL